MSEAHDVLDKIFAALSGGAMGSSGGGLAGALTSGLAGSASSGGAASQQQSGGNTVAEIGMDILKSGFGLVPLVGGLLGLFGGGGSDAPEPLVKYALPQRIDFQGAETAGGMVQADYGQDGVARASGQSSGIEIGWSAQTPAMDTNYALGGVADYSQGGGVPLPDQQAASTSGRGGQTSINVTVQAMDARSFLDRSSDIAAAVRDAMLNLNSINDVVNDL